jgi:aspartate-semialdehyde dehydrogenase
LGATGSVGQRFILLLADHPELELVTVGASHRSAGKPYEEAVDWKQTTPLPERFSRIIVSECKAEQFAHCDVVFSGLDSDYAGTIEKEFVEAGINVISNAKNYRRAPDVPLVVPTVNGSHLDVFHHKRSAESGSSPKRGLHVCISNCATVNLVVPMKALQDKFGPISTVVVTTLQAVSGAGFSPGVPSIDILDNLIPFIGGEEDKLEWEPRKILGEVDSSDKVSFNIIAEDQMRISASCNRVAVTDGHTACVAVKFANGAPSLEQFKEALRSYTSEARKLNCHSAPSKDIEVLEQPNRPQPRLDRDRGNGYAVSVGRIRPDPVLDYKFVSLSHNTVLGAAGSGILIAELLLAKKLI